MQSALLETAGAAGLGRCGRLCGSPRLRGAGARWEFTAAPARRAVGVMFLFSKLWRVVKGRKLDRRAGVQMGKGAGMLTGCKGGREWVGMGLSKKVGKIEEYLYLRIY